MRSCGWTVKWLIVKCCSADSTYLVSKNDQSIISIINQSVWTCMMITVWILMIYDWCTTPEISAAVHRELSVYRWVWTTHRWHHPSPAPGVQISHKSLWDQLFIIPGQTRSSWSRPGPADPEPDRPGPAGPDQNRPGSTVLLSLGQIPGSLPAGPNKVTPLLFFFLGGGVWPLLWLYW